MSPTEDWRRGWSPRLGWAEKGLSSPAQLRKDLQDAALHPCPPLVVSLSPVPTEAAYEPPGLGDSLVHVAGRFSHVSRGGRKSGPLSRSKTKANMSWLLGRSALTWLGRPKGTWRGVWGTWLTGPAPPRAPGGKGHPEQWMAPRYSCKALEGVAHFLRWAFHLASTAQACSQQCTQGIFMEEVHASNSLSSSKLAAPAQKDLGAVNNSVWLRDFHFAGPCLPVPQGPARGWLPAPLRSALPLASQLLSAVLARGSVHAPPCTTSPPQPDTPSPVLPASPSPAPCLRLFSPSPSSLSATSPLLPRLSLPCSILSAFLSLSPLFIGSPLQPRRQSYCAACSLCLDWMVGECCLQGSLPAQGWQQLAAGLGY